MNSRTKRQWLQAVLALVLAFAAIRPTRAEEPAPDEEAELKAYHASWRISAQTDPLAFVVYRGYSAFVGLRPAGWEHWRMELGLNALTLPDPVVRFNAANAGWGVRNHGYFGGVERYFGSGRGGFFVGGYAGVLRSTFSAPGGGVAEVTHVSVMPKVGFQWLPFRSIGLYVTPWLGVSASVPTAGKSAVNGLAYQDSPISPVATLYVGYEL